MSDLRPPTDEEMKHLLSQEEVNKLPLAPRFSEEYLYRWQRAFQIVEPLLKRKDWLQSRCMADFIEFDENGWAVGMHFYKSNIIETPDQHKKTFEEEMKTIEAAAQEEKAFREEIETYRQAKNPFYRFYLRVFKDARIKSLACAYVDNNRALKEEWDSHFPSSEEKKPQENKLKQGQANQFYDLAHGIVCDKDIDMGPPISVPKPILHEGFLHRWCRKLHLIQKPNVKDIISEQNKISEMGIKPIEGVKATFVSLQAGNTRGPLKWTKVIPKVTGGKEENNDSFASCVKHVSKPERA